MIDSQLTAAADHDRKEQNTMSQLTTTGPARSLADGSSIPLLPAANEARRGPASSRQKGRSRTCSASIPSTSYFSHEI